MVVGPRSTACDGSTVARGSATCQTTAPVVECGERAGPDRLTARELIRDAEVVGLRHVDPLAVGRRSPFDPAERRARCRRRAPEDLTRRCVEQPVLAGLLAGADHLSLVGSDVDREQVRSQTEVEVGAGVLRARVGIRQSRNAGDVPVVEALHAGRPPDCARVHVQGHDRVGVVRRIQALRGTAAVLLALLRLVRHRVVVARCDVDGPRRRVDCSRCSTTRLRRCSPAART